MAPRMEKTKHRSIYKRGSRYVVVWEHKGRQHKSFHRTVAEALEAQGQRRQRGERTPVTRQAFEEYANEWLDTYGGRTSRGLSDGTRENYRRSLEQDVIPFFDTYRLAEVEPPDVRRLIKKLEGRGLAPGSVVKILAPLRSLFATAVEDGALRSNPTLGVRVNGRRADAEEEPEAKAMTRAELAALLAELSDGSEGGGDWLLFFELLAHTGLRISEALGLDWPDLVLGAQPKLRVRRQFYRGKLRLLKSRNGKRDLPLSPGLSRRLWAARPAHGHGPMFATRNGTRYIDRNVRRTLDRAKEIVAEKKGPGLGWVGFHTFRHTCASMLFEGGKSIRQVAAWLGHADPAFTLRTYIHLLDDGLGGAEFLDNAVGKGWARQHPETAGNAPGLSALDSAQKRESIEEPQAAASAASSS